MAWSLLEQTQQNTDLVGGWVVVKPSYMLYMCGSSGALTHSLHIYNMTCFAKMLQIYVGSPEIIECKLYKK
jgi:hypothetical protein